MISSMMSKPPAWMRSKIAASSSVSGSSFGSAEKISPVVMVTDPRARVRVDELVDLVARRLVAPAMAASALLTVVSSRRACPACSFAEPP